MEDEATGARTQVFVVRIWSEAQVTGQDELRVQTRDVLTGETRYLGTWPALTAYLASKLLEGENRGAAPHVNG